MFWSYHKLKFDRFIERSTKIYRRPFQDQTLLSLRNSNEICIKQKLDRIWCHLRDEFSRYEFIKQKDLLAMVLFWSRRSNILPTAEKWPARIGFGECAQELFNLYPPSLFRLRLTRKPETLHPYIINISPICMEHFASSFLCIRQRNGILYWNLCFLILNALFKNYFIVYDHGRAWINLTVISWQCRWSS